MKLRLMALFIAAASSPTMAADQFDLKCQGERRLDLKSPIEAHSYGFRIDLKAQKWCWDLCDIVFDIAKIQPDRLILADKQEDFGRYKSYLVNVVDRTDGTHRFRSSMIGSTGNVFTISGKCEPTTFSGFPATKF